MSNKLFKGHQRQEAVIQEQRIQYACMFALASKIVQSKGGVMVLSAEEINGLNTKILRFEAANVDGSSFVPSEDMNHQPQAVKVWIEDPITHEQQPKGLDA